MIADEKVNVDFIFKRVGEFISCFIILFKLMAI
ncbi:hypothetical protein CLV48_11056 [Cecembia rubra]|uniref:Uncharacterized protein n=1 Tax=Cecembia rubra TaxID=1485585 RepID=A0A2P8DYI7_9BACT|nr:hypothetical protein CLV48_11056 [Cecembia rubra]